jgi:hypothetical protein
MDSSDVEFLYFLGCRRTSATDEVSVGIVLLSSNIFDFNLIECDILFNGDATDDEQPGIK